MAFFVALALRLVKAVWVAPQMTNNKNGKANGHVRSEIVPILRIILTSASSVKSSHVKNSVENYTTHTRMILDFSTDTRLFKTLKSFLILEWKTILNIRIKDGSVHHAKEKFIGMTIDAANVIKSF